MNSISLGQFRGKLAEVLFAAIGENQQQMREVSDFMAIVALSRLFAAKINSITDNDLVTILATVEEGVAFGDEGARNAATTGFLENLQNRASAGTFSFMRLTPYLGSESKKYCDAWDNFTGVSTPGCR